MTHIDPSLPRDIQIAHLADLVEAHAGTGYDTSAVIAAACFQQGQWFGFRKALNELREKLANNKTIDTAALTDDFLTDNGAGLHIEHGRWRRTREDSR